MLVQSGRAPFLVTSMTGVAPVHKRHAPSESEGARSIRYSDRDVLAPRLALAALSSTAGHEQIGTTSLLDVRPGKLDDVPNNR